MKNYVTEFIGTFFLVLSIGLSVLGDAKDFAPIAIGGTLMIMVYMGGHVSGAHYNPAVTLAVALRGRLSFAQVVPYWISQIAGAMAAAAVVNMVMGKPLPVAPGAAVTSMNAVLLEFLYTFALALVVLNCATSKDTANNSFYGLAIGFTVTCAAYAAGKLSGGAFNPAVGLGPNLIVMLVGGGGTAALQPVWIYLLGPLAGGAVAAFVFKMQNPGDN